MPHVPITVLLSAEQATGRQTVLSADETFSTQQQDTTKHVGSAPFSTGNKALNFPILPIPTAGRDRKWQITTCNSNALKFLTAMASRTSKKKAEQTVCFSLISSSG